MLCQECQMRQATLHFTKIINGQKTEMHVCEHCAREKGESIPGSDSFSIHHLFSGLFNLEPNEQATSAPKNKPTCPNCGMNYEKFLHVGRFGCASCYDTFSTKLGSVFKRVHGGNNKHTGKIPKRIGHSIQIEKRVEKLREELNSYVQNEEFEKAAELRDEMKTLKKQIEEAKGGE